MPVVVSWRWSDPPSVSDQETDQWFLLAERPVDDLHLALALAVAMQAGGTIDPTPLSSSPSFTSA
jgi:hypothetical protein